MLVSCCPPKLKNSLKSKFTEDGNNNKLGDIYLKINRNLLKCQDAERRNQLLLQNKVEIVHALENMPLTRHDLDALVCDSFLLRIDDKELLSVTLHGQFWEKGATGVGNRSFTRTFILMPPVTITETGWKAIITNDMWNIRNYNALPLPPQEPVSTSTEIHSPNTSLTLQAQQSLPSPLPSFPLQSPSLLQSPPVTQSLPSLPQFSPVTLPEYVQREMVTKFMGVTNLKQEYAVSCLVQSNFNYDDALFRFTVAQSENKIPMDAFRN